MSKPEREIWTPEMDNALVDAFLNQQNLGNKVGGGFTSKAYEAITQELQEKFERSFAKEKVKGRWKLIKKFFSKCYDLFTNGLSGFSWDPITKRWCAEPKVWQKLIETKPKVEEWMRKPIANYDKMMILCRDDRATGQHAETARDIRNKRSPTGETESIEINDVNLESFEDTLNVGNDNNVPFLEEHLARSQGTKAKRSKKIKDESEIEGIKVALLDIAGALKRGNAAIRESTTTHERVQQKLPISQAKIWKLLEDWKIENHLFTRVYLYLLDHPEMIGAVIGIPEDKRKELLLEMVFGPVNPSRF